MVYTSFPFKPGNLIRLVSSFHSPLYATDKLLPSEAIFVTQRNSTTENETRLLLIVFGVTLLVWYVSGVIDVFLIDWC